MLQPGIFTWKIYTQFYDSFVCFVESFLKTHFIEAFHSYISPSISSVVAQTADFPVRQFSCAVLQCHMSLFLGSSVTQQNELELIFIPACSTLRGEVSLTKFINKH